MLPTGVVLTDVSKAFKAFVNRSYALSPLNETWFKANLSSDLNSFKC